MTIHERMIPRTEREKDLLKYGRSQERERIIKLQDEHWAVGFVDGSVVCHCGNTAPYQLHLIALIKGEKK